MRLICKITIGVLAVLLWTAAASAEWESYKNMFLNGEYQQLADACKSGQDTILANEDADIILKYCGMAELELYKKNNQMTDLTTAIGYLEHSLAFRYSEEASYTLGLARMNSLDHVSDAKDQLVRERQALNELWDALRNLHATENFSRDTLSNNMLVWCKETRDRLIDRVLNDEKNQGRLHLLTAMLRALADRFELIKPELGETDVRKGNLSLFKDWMRDLLELSYFDNRIVVGMYKYRGDRFQEQYDQTEKTEEQFAKALYHYTEALKRVDSNKARAVLCADVAYVTSLLTSPDKDKLSAYYKLGFDHAHEGLQIIKKINLTTTEKALPVYPFETDTAELTARLQKSYGSNLTGLTYQYYLRKDFRSIMAMRPYVFDAGFDWENKDVTLTLMSETADKLASEHYQQPQSYRTYKEICLTASNRAFKLVMKKFGGKPPEYTPEFCRAYNHYVNYLSRFGETIEAQNLSRQYEQGCQNVGTPAQ